VKLHLPVIEGIIARRVLVNFRVKPEFIQPLLPAPFRPKLVQGWVMAGLCLIRLEAIRPKGLPAALGLASENVAHRIAVEWDEPGGLREGVFILRRDTDSRVNQLLGGRVFPGVHQRVRIAVWETDRRLKIEVTEASNRRLGRTENPRGGSGEVWRPFPLTPALSLGERESGLDAARTSKNPPPFGSLTEFYPLLGVRGNTAAGRQPGHRLSECTIVKVAARTGEPWPANSIFSSLEDASAFFQRGSCGWSSDGQGGCEGMAVHIPEWRAEPLFVERVESGFFDDRQRFPAGSIAFDSALLMRNLHHEWRVLRALAARKEAA